MAATAARPVEPIEDEHYPHLVRRSFDAAEINPILNDPAVFRFAACEGLNPGSLDVTPLLSDHRNVLLMAERGGILFLWHEPGVYEVHTNFLKPEKKERPEPGPPIGNACRAAYRWMFTHTDCMILLTRIPAHNRAAAVFAPLFGWVKEFERKAVWPSVEDGMVDMSFCSIRYDDWVRKTPSLKKSGRAFHERLEEEFKRHGRVDPQHPDDDCHDLHVGACAEMIMGGQVEKAIALYNRWARFAGYGLMAPVSLEPVVIDIGNALLQVTDDTFKVIMVR